MKASGQVLPERQQLYHKQALNPAVYETIMSTGSRSSAVQGRAPVGFGGCGLSGAKEQPLVLSFRPSALDWAKCLLLQALGATENWDSAPAGAGAVQPLQPGGLDQNC